MQYAEGDLYASWSSKCLAFVLMIYVFLRDVEQYLFHWPEHGADVKSSTILGQSVFPLDHYVETVVGIL